MIALRVKIEDACKEFLRRAPVEESTLTLDGTGVNGHMQFIILKTLGSDVIKRLHRVNLISGSAYAYCAFLAGEEGFIPNMRQAMHTWDQDNRSKWHETSLRRTLLKLWAVSCNKDTLFSNKCLEAMMRATVSDRFANRCVKDLPSNANFWLYSITEQSHLAINSKSSFSETTIAHLGRCLAAIPHLYQAPMIGRHRVTDPVFSQAYGVLKKRLRQEASNHLISNVGLDRTTREDIWVKPHDFGSAKRVVFEDFARMIFNIRNDRIFKSFQLAYGDK